MCQQDPDQDEGEEAPEEQAEYDSLLISAAGDVVASLANALGPEFSALAPTFLPLIMKYYVRSCTLFAQYRSNHLFVTEKEPLPERSVCSNWMFIGDYCWNEEHHYTIHWAAHGIVLSWSQ